MKKIILILLFILFGINGVKAIELDSKPIDYYVAFKNQNYYSLTEMSRYFDKDSFLFMLDLPDYAYNQDSYDYFNENNKNILSKIMYICNEEKNDESYDWYAACQILIWEYLYPKARVYYAGEKENVIRIIDKVKREISYDITFNKYYEISLYKNDIIENKEFINSSIEYSDIDCNLINNLLYVYPSNEGSYNLTLYHKQDIENLTINKINDSYFINNYPDGNITYNVNIRVVNNKYNINSNADSIWSAYDVDHNKIYTFNIKNGENIIYLPLNTEYITEINLDSNYNIIDTIYYLDNIDHTLYLYHSIKEYTDNINEELVNPSTSADNSYKGLFILFVLNISIFCRIIKRKRV